MKFKRNRYWFRPKLFGWGFYPISWEGWLATLVLVGLILIALKTAEDSWRYLFDLAVLVIVFALVALPKTKGKVRWRWGK